MPLFFWQHHRQVVLYGKPGCHLCEDVRALIDLAARRYPLRLTEIDIRSDPVLFRKYDITIPVVIIDGQIELQTIISRADLNLALRQTRGVASSSAPEDTHR